MLPGLVRPLVLEVVEACAVLLVRPLVLEVVEACAVLVPVVPVAVALALVLDVVIVLGEDVFRNVASVTAMSTTAMSATMLTTTIDFLDIGFLSVRVSS